MKRLNNAMYGKRGELSPKFGKPVSEETRQKMSESKKGKKRGPYKKKINC
jgi:hypothetical protein